MLPASAESLLLRSLLLAIVNALSVVGNCDAFEELLSGVAGRVRVVYAAYRAFTVCP
jgi:hypothetical protein